MPKRRGRKTWAQAVQADPGYADWSFAGKPRSFERADQVAKRVSEALKGIYSKYERFEAARKFARKMRLRADHVRRHGCRHAFQVNAIPRDVMAALTMGVGDGNNRIMIQRYEAAAKAAERFCRR